MTADFADGRGWGEETKQDKRHMKTFSSVVMVSIGLLICGCTSSKPAALSPIKAPAVWYQVVPGMTMEQAHAILAAQASRAARNVAGAVEPLSG